MPFINYLLKYFWVKWSLEKEDGQKKERKNLVYVAFVLPLMRKVHFQSC